MPALQLKPDTCAAADTAEHAATLWQKFGWPTPKSESWKYTNLSTLRAQTFAAPAPCPAVPVLPFPTLLYGNGTRTQHHWPDINNIEISTAPAPHAVAAHPENALVFLAQSGTPTHITIRASANHLPVLVLQHHVQNTAVHTPTYIYVEPNTELLLLEWADVSAQSWLNTSTTLHIGAGAMVRWVRLFESSGFTTTHTQVHCHGQLHHTLFLGGSGLNRHMADIALATENAYASLHGLSIPTNIPTHQPTNPLTHSPHTDFTTRITLAHPHTTSRVQHRQVVGENAHAVFQGQFIIPAHAQKTEGHMLVQSLLTAPTARATAKPELAIEADDVQCTHGATTGTLDENQLFYLQARGIAPATARRMLTEAFVADILADTLPADITPHVQSKVEQWLNK